MSRTVEIIALTKGEHYVQFGFAQDELASFKVQMWIERKTKRAIDWLGAMSLGFVSFMGGNVWKHNSDNVPRNNLFGEQKDAKIGFAINEKATVTKILDSLGLYTNGEWEVESVVIPPDLNYPNGMYSRIPKETFQRREGVLYSQFLRNMKTSSGIVNPVEALTGEELRGNSAYVILKHVGGEDVQLWKIDIKAQSSR